jgi:release factor glutamine methyltransferase
MGRSVRIVTLPGVFQPRSDARLLAAVLRERGHARGARVLDVFTGSGALALAAAAEGAREVVAVDVSRRALLTTRRNARRNGLADAVRTRRGDLFAPVAGERFDAILANPPYVPSGTDALPRSGARRAWRAGRDGRLLLDRLCAEAPAHLRPGGALLLVQSSLCGESETLARLAAAGLAEARVVARERGPLGPLMRAALGADAPADEQLLAIEALALGASRDGVAMRSHLQPTPEEVATWRS